MKYLNLNGFIGAPANDAEVDFVEVTDEAMVELIANAQEAGYAITTDLQPVKIDSKIQQAMVEALFKSKYFEKKQKDAEKNQVDFEKVFKLTKENNGKN